MKCAECQVIGDCKHAFGKYWSVKSRGGEGCSKPFPGRPKNWRRGTGNGERGTGNGKKRMVSENEDKGWLDRFF